MEEVGLPVQYNRANVHSESSFRMGGHGGCIFG